jgi:magnesium chelatase subunit H
MRIPLLVFITSLVLSSLDTVTFAFYRGHSTQPRKLVAGRISFRHFPTCSGTAHCLYSSRIDQPVGSDKDTVLDAREPSTRSGIVIIAGFESFNIQLYRKAAAAVTSKVPAVPVSVFTDADIAERPDEVERALRGARVVFCSLIVDFLQVQWVKSRIDEIPIRFVFESALELMSETKVGNFEMKTSPGQQAGPPAPVKAILKQFGSGREEDRMTGYLNFLKVGPKMLKWVPGKKVKDLRTWLTVYSYWSEGATQNVESMLYTIINEFSLAGAGTSAGSTGGNDGIASLAGPLEGGVVNLGDTSSADKGIISSGTGTPQPAALIEYPQQGVFHPDLVTRTPEWLEKGDKNTGFSAVAPNYMSSPRDYCRWYEATHSWVNEDTPRVGILLYRKHVVTEQGYIPNMIKLFESNNIMPIPVFINGERRYRGLWPQHTRNCYNMRDPPASLLIYTTLLIPTL